MTGQEQELESEQRAGCGSRFLFEPSGEGAQQGVN